VLVVLAQVKHPLECAERTNQTASRIVDWRAQPDAAGVEIAVAVP
jgi:hypothetical protein